MSDLSGTVTRDKCCVLPPRLPSSLHSPPFSNPTREAALSQVASGVHREMGAKSRGKEATGDPVDGVRTYP